MSQDDPARRDAGAEPRSRRTQPRRVVVSSVTGEPIAWEDGETGQRSDSARERRPIVPDRVREDEPEPGADESNDSRLAGDVPPHWGHGR